MADMLFGQWLERQFSQTSQASAKEIAAAAGVSQGYLSGLRNSLRASPSGDVAGRIAQAFADARRLDSGQAIALQVEARDVALRSKQRARRARSGTPVREHDHLWARLGHAWSERTV